MRIALLGGVFQTEMARYASSAPEAVLRRFLTELGHEVVAMSAAAAPALRVAADVYHANHFGAGAYALAAAGAHPFVFTPHNPFLVSDWPAPASRLDSLLQRLVLRRADVIVALSEREADLLAARLRTPRDRFVVIPNGLDLDAYGAGEPRATSARIELLSVGQLQAYKGHEHLLAAVARLAPTFPTLRLTLVSHDHTLRPELERRCRDLGIDDRVTFDGPLATADLIERYRACDVYVQPSLAEAFPVTVLEAMACGRPVVATDVGGVAEQVGDTGLVVPPGDVVALADAIGQLARSVDRRRELGSLALERSRRLYDGRAIARRHVELYEGLATRRRRPGLVPRAAARALVATYRRRALLARLVPRRAQGSGR